MEVEEVAKKKMEFEQDLLERLHRFEWSTGCTVHRINVGRVSTISADGERSQLMGVDLDVRIEG